MKKSLTTLSVSLLLLSGQVKAQKPVVVYPNGGETLAAGTTINITWSGVPNGEIVGIDYTTDNWSTTVWLNTNYTSTGSYAWLVPNTPSTQCKVGVFNSSFDGDISDQYFTITGPTALDENVQNPFLAYPNPVDDNRVVTVISAETLQFELFDMTGKQRQVNVEEDKEGYYLNLHDMPSGIYFLKVLIPGTNKIYTKKLIIK